MKSADDFSKLKKLIKNPEEWSKENLKHQSFAAFFFSPFYCTVIRLLLLTGISSMLLIAEILLSLIYGLKAYTVRRREKNEAN
jgi:hypothetical protein